MKSAASIEKVCRASDAFRSKPSMGATKIAKKRWLLPSGVHRIVRSLEHFGYVAQDHDTRKYQIGLELLKFGHLVHERMELREVARPFVRRLPEAAQVTANLAVFDEHDPEVIFVEQLDSPSEIQIRLSLSIGEHVSPHATAVGKVLLACLDRATVRQVLKKHDMPKRTSHTMTDPAELEHELEIVRSQGYGTDHEEAAESTCCIGPPVRNHKREVVAAVSISMMAANLGREDEPRLVSPVKTTAAQISAALGYEQDSSEAKKFR